MKNFLIISLFLMVSLDASSQLKYSNRVSIYYTNNSFTETFAPMQFTSAEYLHKFKMGSLLTRVNYSRRFNKNAFQFELDAYPRFNKFAYMYVNTGYSPDSLYPKFRFGIEMYRVLKSLFEISGGFRYIKNYSDNNVFLLTSSLTKYFSHYMLTGRVYFNVNAYNNFTSFILNARKYFNDFSFAGLTFGYGNSPDEAAVNVISKNTGNINMHSLSVFIDYQDILFKNIFIKAGLGFEREEYTENKFRNKIISFAGCGILF